MPTITTSSVFTYIGLLLVLLGFFMIFAGLRIVSVEKVTVAPGPKTWLLGLLLLVFGIGLLALDLFNLVPSRALDTGLPASTTRQITFTVQANQSWQDTGLTVIPNHTVTVQYQSGKWTGGIGTGNWYDGSGDLIARYKCAEQATDPGACIEPMPTAYNGTLIGRVGDTLLEVGNLISHRANSTGTLQLRMNDADAGLYDNEGELVVLISID